MSEIYSNPDLRMTGGDYTIADSSEVTWLRNKMVAIEELIDGWRIIHIPAVQSLLNELEDIIEQPPTRSR